MDAVDEVENEACAYLLKKWQEIIMIQCLTST